MYYSHVSRTIVILWLLAVLLFVSGESGQAFAQRRFIEKPVARTFDEYGNLRGCDHSARLDNFAIQLQHERKAYGYVLVYAPAAASKHIRQIIVDYIVNTRDISRERIKTYHAGYNDVLGEPRIQLWIVPEGAEPPKPKKRKVNLAAFKGMLAEYQESDNIELGEPSFDLEDPGTGPPVGNVTFALIDDVLKAQKHSIAHVVAFNGVEEVPGAWRRVAESTVEMLKHFGFESSRFKVSYGGQFKQTKVQLWILPPGEMPPVKDPRSEPAATKALQIGEFDHATLGYAKNELSVFERLLTVLRENPEMRACLIVRMEVPVADELTPELQAQPEPIVPAPDEPRAATGPEEPEPEPADLPKLVEKWKSELAAKHKLPPDRVVVLFANAQEYHMPSLEIWVVPPSQPLPIPIVP
jgi:hypothetical protein